MFWIEKLLLFMERASISLASWGVGIDSGLLDEIVKHHIGPPADKTDHDPGILWSKRRVWGVRFQHHRQIINFIGDGGPCSFRKRHGFQFS